MRVGPVGPDDQVGEPVAVDVPGAGDAPAAKVTRALAVDDETAVRLPPAPGGERPAPVPSDDDAPADPTPIGQPA